MEVHHHPHPGKNFKEYLLEGLMIFFAVSMGFIAEQLRETLVEREHEKAYMRALVEDLQHDVDQLPGFENWYRNQLIPAGDTIKLLLRTSNAPEPDNALYVNFRYLIRYLSINVVITNRTYTQLKNNGGLRLVETTAVSDSILNYYNDISVLHELEEYLFQEKQEMRQLLPRVLRGEMYDQVVNERDQVIRPAGDLYAKNISEEQINDYLMRISDINGVSRNILKRLVNLREKAQRLKEFISASYHLTQKETSD